MESRKSAQEQKLTKMQHPRWSVSTKIGIVGGGPSGLSAAYALIKLGYNNVTILEKYHSVGGMCESVNIEGKIYDLGGQVLAANSAPVIFPIAKEIGCELEEMDSHTFATIDTSTGQYKDMEIVDDYLSVISLTLKLQDEAKDTGLLGVHAMSKIAAEPTPEFLKRHGFKTVPKSVAYGFTASGYGFVEDMPYAYVHEFTRTSMAGKTRRFKGGYMSFWQKMAQSLPIEVHCNTEVLAIRRRSDEVSVEIRNSSREIQVMKFDKIIISGSFPFRNGKTYRSPFSNAADMAENGQLDVTETERELFGKVKAIDYYTTVLKIKGLEHLPMGFYYFDQFMNDPATIGHPVAMQRFYSETNIFLFWSYGNSVDIKEEKILEIAIKDVECMGGKVEKVILQRRFKYFPHVGSEDMRNHFYDKLEKELQGQNNTYYVGGLMAFELTERNSEYSMALVQKHFASETPVFSYVKRLFPMQSDSNILISRQLDELPGVEFPNLCTLDGYLQHWGTHNVTANKTLYSWIGNQGETVACRTYRELHTNAARLAHKLLTNPKPVIKPGDRVLLVYLPGLDFIDAFFGCLRARVVPVPALPPDPSQKNGGQALLHIQNIARSCNAVAILSTFGFHAFIQAGALKNMILSMGINGKNSLDWPDLPWIHTDTWIRSCKVPENSTTTEPLQDDLCFLQYTSGSTGDAKGVMITHGALIHNVKMMRRRYKSTSKTVLVSWLPQYHDMGLIGGFFTTLVSGGTAILFSPLTFIHRPLLWLHTMSKYRATHSAGPNFAFELIVRRLESNKDKMEINLSSMIFLMVAAEPVRAETLKRFIELTRPFGLCQEIIAPGYGLAENCVFVSCAFGEGKPIFVDWQQRVCCGYIYKNDPDVDVKIVDPGRGQEKLNFEDEGEIWISSPSSGVGYWGKEELSQETFNNELKNHRGKKYIRTGDLGRVIDGKLFITGRIKDVIIVGGRNIYSSDIEKTVENSSELLRPGCCAVIVVPEEVLSAKGIRNPNISDQFGLVVLAEVREGKRVTADVIEKIQTHVVEEHGIILASIVLIKPRTISKTTSGKIKRYECLRQFIDGTLRLVADSVVKDIPMAQSPLSTPSRMRKSAADEEKTLIKDIGKNEIVEFLKGLLSEQVGISTQEISVTEGLMSYGIDSIGVVRAAQKLSDFLGVPVGAIDIFSATCIDDLANFAESLLAKSRPQLSIHPSAPPGNFILSGSLLRDASPSRKSALYLFQLLALVFVATLLTIPAYFSLYSLTTFISTSHIIFRTNPCLGYLTYLVCTPLAWLLCIASTCIFIALVGNSFLQPNYALNSSVSIWSMDFVKWWALYKVQELSSNVLAVHLRGTVFLNYWFTMFGAKIGSSVLLDTVDITDPYMVEIGDGAVIAEGALLQCHEVKRGILSFCPTRIGRNSSVGPYAVVQKGSIVDEGVEVEALQTTEGGNIKNRRAKEHSIQKEKVKLEILNKNEEEQEAFYHFMGIYMVGFLSSLSAAIVYVIYTWLSQTSPSIQHFGFACICGTFHWFPYILIAYATMFSNAPSSVMTFAASVAIAYLSHGLILTMLTSILSYFLGQKQQSKHVWLRHRFIVSCHLKFAKLISGTEAFCTYLRLLGATIGRNCSIRAINPILNPELISIGAGVHLGDFSRIISGFYSSKGFIRGNIEVRDNTVTGSQSLILPGSVIQEDVILGALSIAPLGSILYRGGVFVGSHTPVMVKNTMVDSDERIDEMDFKYKKILGGLAANLASTTLKVRSRYFHRIGAAGKGFLRIYDHIPGFQDHKIIKTGKRYPVIIRHSNCLSSDDDARKDPRGAAVRILSDANDEDSPLLDLTLKTGRAFHARTIADFATWLICGVAAREEHVKRAPHIREAMWDSLRQPNSYADLHYYSNICRLFRFKDGQEMYAKFKLRPFDETIGEESGKVEPDGILPPETGAIPRDENDTRPLLFLDKDFKDRLKSPTGIRYVLQLQVRPVPDSEEDRDDALDCTKPWVESEFPYIDVGEMTIDQDITKEESEQLEFNPYLRCREVDVIRASSCTQSASMDHGRSVVYAICQHLRNKKPLPEAWRIFLDQSDVKVDISGCPMAAALAPKDSKKVTLARTRYQDIWATSAQPLLQVTVPYFLMGLVTFAPLNCLIHLKENKELQLHWMLPVLWIFSGILMAISCAIAKWVLVGKKKEGETMMIWSRGIFMDTIWQAIRTLAGEYFMQITTGSALFGIWMNLMGSNICWYQGAYIDSMEAVLNPEMVVAKKGACVERGALLFGHLYEGEGGKVKYGKVTVGGGGFIGSRAVAMPGVIVENEGNLGALSLAMKEEIVRSR